MGRGSRVERALAVVGAATVLVIGFDSMTYASTGSSLLLGRTNKAGGVTTVQNTGKGAALNLVTRSTAYPPFTTNAKGLVPNLYAARAANADKLGGLTLARIQAAAKGATGPAGPQGPAGPATGAAGGALTGTYPNPQLAPVAPAHLLGSAGEPSLVTSEPHFGNGGWANLGGGWAPGSFRRDPFGEVHLGGLLCPVPSGMCDTYATVPGGATFVTLFTLPAGYRPATRLVFAIMESDHVSRLDVLPSGEVKLLWTDGPVHAYVSLDGVSFTAAA